MSSVINHDPRVFKRLPKVRVGDLVFYHYRYYGLGMSQQAHTTREVIEVIDGGAKFVVDGGFRINATQIDSHIPMHRDGDSRQEQEAGEDF